jgi:predicted RNA-binding protein with PIN domain
MIIVVDGYNVLKLVNGADVSESQRMQFIKLLGSYARRKQHMMTIVFDGGPHEWPTRDRESGVYVVYSGHNETADDYIMHFLDEKRAYDVLLVSSDRVLNDYAASHDIPSIDSDYFWALVQRERRKSAEVPKKKKTDIIKLTEEENPAVDVLMQEAGHRVEHKTEDMLPSMVSQAGNKMSKKERRLQAIIKKL